MKETSNSRNSVVLRTAFDFKGKHFTPSASLDLDQFFRSGNDMDYCYTMLAQANDIGLYSYELEVMMCNELVFSEPTGWAVGHVENGRADWEALEHAWRNQACLLEAAEIASKHFNIENLDEHPRLAAALMDAYRLGSDTVAKKNIANNGLNEGFYG